MTRPGNTAQLNVTVPKDLIVELKQEAEKENRSLSNFVASLLIEAMKNRKQS